MAIFIDCNVCGYFGEPLLAITIDWLQIPKCPECGAFGKDLELIEENINEAS